MKLGCSSEMSEGCIWSRETKPRQSVVLNCNLRIEHWGQMHLVHEVEINDVSVELMECKTEPFLSLYARWIL